MLLSERIPTFVRIPSGWIVNDRGLRTFPGGTRGEGIAALKTYLAIARAAGEQRFAGGAEGVATLTYDQLAKLADVARGQLPAALDLLNERIERRSGVGQQPNTYRIIGYREDRGWAQVPARWLWLGHGNPFQFFTPRRRVHLNALKLYLLFLAFRDIRKNQAHLSYKKITEYTGLQAPAISPGISVLIDANLISVGSGALAAAGPDSTVPEVDEERQRLWNLPNYYRIRGLTSRLDTKGTDDLIK